MDLVALRNRLIEFAKVVEGKRYYEQIVDYRANPDFIVFAGSCSSFYIRTKEWPAETYDRKFDLKSLNNSRFMASIDIKRVENHFFMITNAYQSLRSLHNFMCPQCMGEKKVEYEYKTKWKDFRKSFSCPICQGNGVLSYDMIEKLSLSGIFIDVPSDISVEIPGFSMPGKLFCELIDLCKWFGLDRFEIEGLMSCTTRKIRLSEDVCMFLDTFSLGEYHVNMRSVLCD